MTAQPKHPQPKDAALKNSFNRAQTRKPVNDNAPDADDVYDPMPRWNLADLYPGLDSPELAADKARLEKMLDKFAETFEGTLKWLSGADLGEAIRIYEMVEREMYRISCYITLLEADHVDNFAKTGDLKNWYQETGGKTAFFEAELAALKESELMAKMQAPELARYAPWIAAVREGNKKPLPDGVSNLSADFDAASREGWTRLYHETMSALTVEIDGEQVPFDDVALGSDPAARRETRQKLADALKQNGKRMALIYNTILRDDMIDADLRGYARPDESVNRQNRVEDEVVDTMFETIKASYGRLSHRFYAWKAAEHGETVLPREKLTLPPPALQGAAPEFTFEEGKKIVLRAFRKFSPKFARIAEKIFDAGHIDAEPRPGKESGAFALPTGPGSLPYIMLSYLGGVEDVAATLGHELGHGIHQVLAEKACGHFLSDVPTPVAETASIFAEMLVFDELLKLEKDPVVKKRLMMERVENMLGNGLQQLAYYDFEKRVHKARRDGELDVEQISDIWIATQKEYYGPAVALDDYDRYYWMTVPHLFDTPFYVYSYAFAQQVVSGLYQLYRDAAEEGKEARDDFVQRYIGLLETGMTKNLYEMFQPFDLDPETPAFWENGLNLVSEYMDALEKMDITPKAAPKKPRKPKGPKA